MPLGNSPHRAVFFMSVSLRLTLPLSGLGLRLPSRMFFQVLFDHWSGAESVTKCQSLWGSQHTCPQARCLVQQGQVCAWGGTG